MTRVKSGKISKNRHKKVLQITKGFRGRNKNCFRIAIEKAEKALSYSYRDRRTKKRTIRSLWIQRINAGVRKYGMTYSEFMGKIKKISIKLDRKILAELAVNNQISFQQIAEQAKNI